MKVLLSQPTLRCDGLKRRQQNPPAHCQKIIAGCELTGYNQYMIKSFAHKGLKKFFLTGSKARIQAKHEKRIHLILAQLNQARNIQDMDIPTLKLHRLKGNRKSTWAVTVQANWRITFRFVDGNAEHVNYEDYH